MTRAAFAGGLTDTQRAEELSSLDGFRRGTFAIGSAVLCAWKPEDFSVTDFHARRALKELFANCRCKLTLYSVFAPAVRALRDGLNTGLRDGIGWTAHDVDRALMLMDSAQQRTTPRGTL